MNGSKSTDGQSGDLFGEIPTRRTGPGVKHRLQPELIAARTLCRQLRRTPVAREKQRIAHLICLNLVSILRQGS